MPQRRFVEYHYVVQALRSQRADETLRIRVLPRAFRRCQHFADSHFPNSLTECCSVKCNLDRELLLKSTSRLDGLSARPGYSSDCKDVPGPDRRLRSRSPETSAQDYKKPAYFSIHFSSETPQSRPLVHIRHIFVQLAEVITHGPSTNR